MAPKGRGGKGGKAKSKQAGHRETKAAVSASNPAARRAFPTNVIFAILSRLPVKSVLRFKSASKQWRMVCNLPSFAADHLSRSTAGLLIHATCDPLLPVAGGEPFPDLPDSYAFYAYARPAEPQPEEQSTVDFIHFPGYDGVTPLDVVGTTPNGLVCIVRQHLAQHFTIWNPATRSSLRIPAPSQPDPADLSGASAGLAFDPSSNEYTLIRIVRFIPQFLPDVAELFSFQTGRWDRLVNDGGGVVPFRTTAGTCEVVVDGVPYWTAMEKEEGMPQPVLKLAWFDRSSPGFKTAMFRWRVWSDTEMCLGEITPGYLGALVWDRQERVWMDRAVDVWTWEHIFGAWVHTHKIEMGGLQVVGRVVGFYGDEELVQEVLDGTVEEPIPCLCMTKFRFGVKVKDLCALDASPGTCKVASYRPTLTRLPRIGSSLI